MIGLLSSGCADVVKFRAASDSGLGAAADTMMGFAIGSARLNFVKLDTDAAVVGDQGLGVIGADQGL